MEAVLQVEHIFEVAAGCMASALIWLAVAC
jgi:hypothetical protein